MVHALELGQVGVDDAGERDLVEVDLLAGDQVEQQVEGPLEDRGADLVRHPSENTGRSPRPRRIPWPAMTRVFSGIQPTGDTHLGNYLGAVRNWVETSTSTTPSTASSTSTPSPSSTTPAELRAKTLTMATLLLAAGLDPDVCTLFVQSHVPEHSRAELAAGVHRQHGRAAPHDPVQGQDGQGGRGLGPGRACSPTRSSRPPTSSSTTPTASPSARTSASTSSSPATSPSGSTTATARRSSCPTPPSRRWAPGSWTCRTRRRRCRSRADSPQGHGARARPARGHRAQVQAGRHRHRRPRSASTRSASPGCPTCSRSSRSPRAAAPTRQPRATRSTGP